MSIRDKDATFERFYIPSVPGIGGWAVIFLDSCGTFSAVSDYGNYGYVWTNPGRPFHEFLMGLDNDYLSRKLADGAREYQGEETHKEVLVELKRLLDAGDLDEQSYDEELLLLEDHDNLDSEVAFHTWMSHTQIEAHELGCWSVPNQVKAFCINVWPKFVEQLRKRIAESTGV